MSKAILVMDMPTDCEDCPLFQDGDKGMRQCKTKRTGVEWDYYKVRPAWCPLKLMPEKVDASKFLTQEFRAFYEGRNTCINEIN